MLSAAVVTGAVGWLYNGNSGAEYQETPGIYGYFGRPYSGQRRFGSRVFLPQYLLFKFMEKYINSIYNH